ncbi:2'-5' RNA ligase family protein [Enemella sp. A6]|uniref:2'-5' RNA ligase family protein n=1 Tax=Enemella sp. A6 TaxID=3440152 RepID=UPI003EBE7858
MQITLIDGITETRNHWEWRRGWQPGRRNYTFHLTMEQAPAVHEIADRVGTALGRHPELDLIPRQWLHLTMTGIGFTDEIDEQHVAAIADPVFEAWRVLQGPELTFTGLLVADEAVMLTAEVPEWLTVLLETQRAGVDEVRGPRQWGPFRPHVSLSYSNGTAPIGPIVDDLSQVAAGLDESVSVTPTLTLMRLGKDNRMWEWDVLRQEPAC